MTDDEFDRREEIVQTERGFTIDVSHKRGTDVRDQDEVSATWNMEHKPPENAFTELVHNLESTMERLRDANRPGEDES